MGAAESACFANVLISVVIPTHNRHALLRNAVTSVAAQQYAHVEIVIVDDGSDPPIANAAGLSDLAGNWVLIRHDRPLGIAAARYHGVRAAQGDLILNLDDDDELAAGALARIADVFRSTAALDVLYLGVEGFGLRARDFAAAQTAAIGKLLEATRFTRLEAQNTVIFEDGIFPALLNAVPSAFQRPVANKATWLKVFDLRDRVYTSAGLEPDLPDSIAAVNDIQNECEWTLLAASTSRIGYLPEGLYRLRCDGLGYYSRIELATHHRLANNAIKERLRRAAPALGEIKPYASLIRDSYADSCFSLAYAELLEGDRLLAWKYWWAALCIRRRPRYFRLMPRLILPRRQPGFD